MPQPQGRPPRSRLAWVLPTITHAFLVGSIGFCIWALMVIFHEPHLQIFVGSGWWQYGAMAVALLLYALMGFSVKVSALITRRMPKVLWIPATKLLEFNAEAFGLVYFIGFGLLPLCIHPADELMAEVLILGNCALLIGILITKIKPIQRRLKVALGSTGSNGQSLISQPVYLSRRVFLSGGATLGIGAAGLVVFWRALPALIPDYTFFGHDSAVISLSWFPDGRRIVSADSGGKVLTWNAADGSNSHASLRLKLSPTKVQVSPNGKLVAASDDGSLYMADVATGTTLWIQKIGYSERPFSWAPDSTHVTLISYGSVRTIDAVTGEEATTVLLPPANFAAQAVAWSPDGKSVAATDGVQVVLWDAASGVQREVYTLPVTTDIGVSDFAWSPDGRSLAIALERVVYVWSLDNAGPPVAYREFSDTAYTISLSWSPDGRYIASGGDETVRVWEAATGKTVFVYNGHFSSVQAVAWAPDGRRIASGGWDKLVHVWRPVLPA